jgi:hypothetical protein
MKNEAKTLFFEGFLGLKMLFLVHFSDKSVSEMT